MAPQPGQKLRPFSPEDDSEIVRLYAEGLSYGKIGARLDHPRHKSTIYTRHQVILNGPRPRGGRKGQRKGLVWHGLGNLRDPRFRPFVPPKLGWGVTPDMVRAGR